MQVLRVETVTEQPGICTVEAFRPAGMMEREGQMVGFFVRARHERDQFQIAKWEDFSPRWMKFVGSIPEGWEEKLQEREAKRGLVAELSIAEERATPTDKFAQVARHAAGEAIALSQIGNATDAGTLNYASGKITKTLSVKK